MKKSKYKPKEKDKNRKVELYPAIKITIDGNKYGYINKEGKEIIPFKFMNAYNFNQYGLAIITEEGGYGIINSEGTYIVNAEYSLINPYSEGRSIYVENTSMGILDEKGNKLNNVLYDYIGNYKNGYAVMGKIYKNNCRYGYLNLNGDVAYEAKYIEASDFNENYALVKIKDMEYSLIDTKGNIINTYNYEYVGSYGNDLMVFSILLGGPYGYISRDGKIVIQPIYSYAKEFIDGISIVSTSDEIDKYGVIDKLGHPIYGEIYSDIKYLGEGRLALGLPIGKTKLQSRIIYAVGDDKGIILTKFKFFKVNNFLDGIASVSDSRKTFFINKDGKELNNLPSFLGSGELYLLGDIVQAYVDYYIYYLDKNNKIIYGPNKKIKLNEVYSISIEKYRPNINYLIYMPTIYGMNNKEAQNQLNIELMKLSIFNPPDDDIYVQKQFIITDKEIWSCRIS
ncbi:WG repeat-containing protein, partial [Clostridium sp. C8]|uniref:WG repeat-containing protein n=1 Tax=Clostridium sp. C8 TaxID=1667357 RepID=UPI000699395D